MALGASKATSARKGDPSKEDTLRSFRAKPARNVNMRDAVKDRKGAALGRLLGVTGTTGSGKSSFIQSAGWMNLKYKDILLKETEWKPSFPKCVKLLQRGIMPEIEKIGIVESDMKSIDDAVITEWKKLYGPLIENGVYEVSECFIISHDELSKSDSKSKKKYQAIIDEQRIEYESAVINFEKNPDIQLVALDNASDYLMALLSQAEATYPDSESWIHYGKRKKWFFDYLAVAKASKKMHIMIFRLKEQLEFRAKQREKDKTYDMVFEEPWYKIEWPSEVGYKLDNFYLFMRDYVRNKFAVKHKKGCWAMNPREISLPHDPFNYPRVMEASADILLEEYDPDKFEKGEKFW